MVLIAHKTCLINVERYSVRSAPTLLWIETLEFVRIGSKEKFRDRAYLYAAHFVSREEGKVWYRWTGREVSSTTARLIALPGKWMYRYKRRRANKPKALAPKPP